MPLPNHPTYVSRPRACIDSSDASSSCVSVRLHSAPALSNGTDRVLSYSMGQRHRDELAAIDSDLENRIASYTTSIRDISITAAASSSSSSPSPRDVPLAAAATLMAEIGFDDDDDAECGADSERDDDSADIESDRREHGDGSGDGDRGAQRMKRRRSKLPLKAVLILREYFARHLNYPYPSDEDKKALADLTDLTVKQVCNWFTNSRKRYWQPYMKTLQTGNDDDDNTHETTQNAA